MQSYLDDKDNFDADLKFGQTKITYLALPTADQEELKRVIPANVDVIDLKASSDLFSDFNGRSEG